MLTASLLTCLVGDQASTPSRVWECALEWFFFPPGGRGAASRLDHPTATVCSNRDDAPANENKAPCLASRATCSVVGSVLRAISL